MVWAKAWEVAMLRRGQPPDALWRQLTWFTVGLNVEIRRRHSRMTWHQEKDYWRYSSTNICSICCLTQERKLSVSCGWHRLECLNTSLMLSRVWVIRQLWLGMKVECNLEHCDMGYRQPQWCVNSVIWDIGSHSGVLIAVPCVSLPDWGMIPNLDSG